MQQLQHHKFILNQPQKICTSTQSHWKDQQFSCLWQNPTQNRNEWKRHKNAKRAICHWTVRKASSTTRCGERRRPLARRENIRWGELGSTRRATKNTRCGELWTTRQAAKYTRWASDDICSLGEFEHSRGKRRQTGRQTDLCSHSKTLILTTPTQKLIGNITYCFSTT